ncbi:MAG: YcxB family protein [Oscillospiraceae bacterium]
MISYSLNENEIKAALKQIGAFKEHRNGAILKSILFLFGFSLFASAIIKNPDKISYWVIAAICLIFIPVIWTVNIFKVNSIVKKAAESGERRFEIEENRLIFSTEKTLEPTEVSAETVTKIFQDEKIIVMETGNKQLFVIPKRVISKEEAEKIKEIFESIGNKGDKK